MQKPQAIKAVLTIATILLLATTSIAENIAYRYTSDPTFSALSRKGTPKDIMRGGGKRGCLDLARVSGEGLTAVIPQDDGGGLSATPNPTFWVYVPYAVDNGTPLSAVLSLRQTDSFKSAPIQKVPITLPGKPGLVSLKLPVPIAQPGLLAWTLTIICDAENPARNPFVTGLVMIRSNPQLLQRLGGLSRGERVMEYARSGYWYDALAIVMGTDEDLARQQLLESVGLKTTHKKRGNIATIFPPE
jgi:Domain of Unknown Function (DUF928)